MHVLLVGTLCILASLQSPLPPRPTSSPAGETIKIDGNEHPERIPDHWVWRSGFLKLGEINRSGPESYLEQQLPLSSADARVLFKEAALQSRRDGDCAKAIESRQETLRQRKASASAIADALNEVTLDCRSKDLDAADRVMDQLSEDGQQNLRAWIERLRRNTTVFVPVGDVDIFKLPR